VRKIDRERIDDIKAKNVEMLGRWHEKSIIRAKKLKANDIKEC